MGTLKQDLETYKTEVFTKGDIKAGFKWVREVMGAARVLATASIAFRMVFNSIGLPFPFGFIFGKVAHHVSRDFYGQASTEDRKKIRAAVQPVWVCLGVFLGLVGLVMVLVGFMFSASIILGLLGLPLLILGLPLLILGLPLLIVGSLLIVSVVPLRNWLGAAALGLGGCVSFIISIGTLMAAVGDWHGMPSIVHLAAYGVFSCICHACWSNIGPTLLDPLSNGDEA